MEYITIRSTIAGRCRGENQILERLLVILNLVGNTVSFLKYGLVGRPVLHASQSSREELMTYHQGFGSRCGGNNGVSTVAQN